jgi:hypothetical protein
MRFLLLTITLLSTSSLACDVPLGEYEALIESEYSVSLVLLKDGRYKFIHKNWLPGDLRHVGEEHIYKGTFTCTKNQLTLDYTDSGETITATYKETSLKELGFPNDIKAHAIKLAKAKDTKSIMSSWLLWPKGFLNEAFNAL